MPHTPTGGEDWEFGPLDATTRLDRAFTEEPRHKRAEPMRFNLGSLLLVVLVGAGLCFVTAPWFAFRSLRDAARTNDTAALTEAVDYNSVRRSLTDQLSGRPVKETPPPNIWQDPIGALKNAFDTQTTPITPQVEGYVSPKGLAALADGRPYNQPLAANAGEPFPTVLFWGPSRCRIGVRDPLAHSRRTEFTFERKGIFSWKLTRIMLPQTAAAMSGAPAPAKAG